MGTKLTHMRLATTPQHSRGPTEENLTHQVSEMNYKEFRQQCLMSRESKKFLCCGSAFELPVKFLLINPTDADRIFYMMDICAIPTNRNPPKNFKGTVLIVESTGNHFGFVKLKQGNSYFLRPTHLSKDPGEGPARKVDGEFSLSPKLQALFRICFSRYWTGSLAMKIDESYSVYCPYWPPEVEEWLTRKRYSGWPDEELIVRVKKGGCHFVSKSHPNNPQDNAQWRFSFSKAELILIHSWTPVQKTVYHILRLVQHKVIEDCGGSERTVLRTYYIKTLMFWACEQKPSEFWNENNIRVCVRELLQDTIKALKCRLCPNYFIPENNMLDFLENINLENELKSLKTYARGERCNIESKIVAVLQQSDSGFYLPNSFYEFLFISMRSAIFPLPGKLTGFPNEKLYNCECFLPELKELYNAITANARLMSLNEVNDRRISNDYSVAYHGYTAALNASTDERQRILKLNISRALGCSISENMLQFASWPLFLHRKYIESNVAEDCEIANFVREIIQSEDCELSTAESSVERRTGISSFHKMVIGKIACSSISKLVGQLSKQIPSSMYLMSAAYLANFYYNALNDHERALRICDEIYVKRSKIRKISKTYIYFYANLPIPVCTDFSVLFDNQIRTVLGFVMLLKTSSPCSSSDDLKKVAFPLSPVRFLRYIEYQCKLKTDRNVPNVFAYTPDEHENANNSSRMTVCFSEVFLSAAMRSNRVKIIRLSSRNLDADKSFGEVVGRICCHFDETLKDEDFRGCLRVLNVATDSENQLELHKIGMIFAELRAERVLLYFHFPLPDDVKIMQKKLKSGNLRTVVENDFNKLLNRMEMLISVSVEWFPGDYKRCIRSYDHN